MPNPYAPAQIDFSSLAQLPQLYQQGQQYARQNQLRQALSQGVPMQGGMPDYAALSKLVAPYDPQAAISLAEKMPTYQWGEITKPAFGTPGQLGFVPPRPGMPTLDAAGNPVDAVKMQQEEQSNILLDDETLTNMAQMALAGDRSVFTNLGRGAIAAQNNAALRKKMFELGTAAGQSPSDIARGFQEYRGYGAAQTTLGQRAARVGLAISEAQQMMPLALSASAAVDRTQYPDINSVILAYRQKTGDPNVTRFGASVNALVNAYARAINPSGIPTDADKAAARDILDKSWSQGQFAAGVDQLMKEMQAAQKSVPQVRKELRENYFGPGGELNAPPVPGAMQPIQPDPRGPLYPPQQGQQPLGGTTSSGIKWSIAP